MRRRELPELYANLEAMADKATGKLAYAIVKNLDILEKEKKHLQNLGRPSKDIEAYDAERVALCEARARKNADGGPVLKRNEATGTLEYDIEDRDEFRKALEAIRKKHEKALAAHETRLAELEALLDEESDLALYKVPYSAVDPSITAAELRKIWPIITDDAETAPPELKIIKP